MRELKINHAINSIKPFMDSYYCIIQKDRDAGDSCQRTLSFFFMIKILDRQDAHYSTVISMLQKKPGRYARHWDESRWWGNIDAFSGDQCRPLIMALGATQWYLHLQQLFDAHADNNFFYWNRMHIGGEYKKWWQPSDFIGPTDIGLYVRAYQRKTWLLYITDWFLLLAVIWRIIVGKLDSNNTGDDLNLSLTLFQSRKYHPTFISNIAWFLYTRLRNYRRALAHYFRPDTLAPPMELLYFECFEHLK